jgi:hypothetical protein
MARYFFHLTGRFAWDDSEGAEFPTPEAAVAEARQILCELARNRQENESRGWRLRLTNDAGTEIALVTTPDGLAD